MKRTISGLFGTFFAATVAFAGSGVVYEVCGLDPEGDNFLALRDLPSTRSQMVRKLGPGTLVESRGDVVEGKWLPVTVATDNINSLPYGYVHTGFICPL